MIDGQKVRKRSIGKLTEVDDVGREVHDLVQIDIDRCDIQGIVAPVGSDGDFGGIIDDTEPAIVCRLPLSGSLVE